MVSVLEKKRSQGVEPSPQALDFEPYSEEEEPAEYWKTPQRKNPWGARR